MLIDLEVKPEMHESGIAEQCPRCIGKDALLMKLKPLEFDSLCGGYFVQYFYWECVSCEDVLRFKNVTKYEKKKAIAK